MIGAWALRDWLGPKLSSPTVQAVQPLQLNPLLTGQLSYSDCVQVPSSGDTAASAPCDMRCNEWQ